MTGVAFFRLPYQHTCTMMTGEVAELPSMRSISGNQGFVIAPFSPTLSTPVLLIHAAKQQQFDDAQELTDALWHFQLQDDGGMVSGEQHDYHAVFTDFHDSLVKGDFQKLVLSRRIDLDRTDAPSPIQLFKQACARYPRMFICLTFTTQSGLWLTATPEILLSGEGDKWHTMALAGTMPYADAVSWSDKNIQEQRYVATYIAKTLKQFTDDYEEKVPARRGLGIWLTCAVTSPLPCTTTQRLASCWMHCIPRLLYADCPNVRPTTSSCSMSNTTDRITAALWGRCQSTGRPTYL